MNEEVKDIIVEPFIEKNYADEDITGVIYNDKKIYFNSMYDTESFINVWSKQSDISSIGTILVVFGIADLRYLKKLRDMNNDMIMIVYEPSEKYAEFTQEHFDISSIANHEKTIMFQGKQSLNEIYKLLGVFIKFENYNYVRYFVSPNYELVYEDDINELRTIIRDELSVARTNRNTNIYMNEDMRHNNIDNMIDMIEQYSFSNLKKQFDNVDMEKIPAIIVSAGPSLDKNILELKKAKNKAFIIAVDTALNALDAVDIVPDMTITVDPQKEIKLFRSEKMRDVPIIFELSSNHKILEIYRGKRFYSRPSYTWLERYEEEYGKESLFIETGGSVANSACSVVQRLGFKTVIFVGQDLAYPGDKGHAEKSVENIKSNTIENDGKIYFYVEDIYGGQVKTEHNMNQYRKWFERAVKVYSDIRYIDATEGGAKINGTEIMTLSDAIKETCIYESEMDFGTIINGTNPYYTEEEKKKIYSDLANFDKEVDEIRKRIKDGIVAYEKLDEFNRKQKYTGKEFNDIIEKITDINNWISNDKKVSYLVLYSATADYKVREHIYENKENVYEEIKLVVTDGIELLKTLQKSTEEVLEDMKKNMQIAKEKLS